MKYTLSFGGLGALCLLLAPATARAQVSMPTVTQPSAGLFHYDYSIFNNTPDDLFDVDIHVSVGPGMVTNLNAPTGFMTAYDSSLGLVSFLEDTDVFTVTPLSGFVFDSTLGPQSSTFDANFAVNGITTTSGTTLAPLAQAAVPEPGNIAWCGAIGVASTFALWRRRRKVSA